MYLMLKFVCYVALFFSVFNSSFGQAQQTQNNPDVTVEGEKLFQRCLQCHGEESRINFLEKDQLEYFLNPSDVEQGEIWYLTNNNQMPLDRPFTKEEKEIFNRWIKEVLAKKFQN
ncbi:MAG: hypothetical protein QE271_09990 [Bacteriovoracaceae bacterium]|nr:hypothetical protein [Bacteriovoracaceae bacterium]